MNDEIKEILEGMKVVIKHEGSLEFDTKELKVLLDYITKLQEENKRLQKLEQEHQRINGELREENKRLRETNKIFSERIISENNPDYCELREENKRLREQLEAKD